MNDKQSINKYIEALNNIVGMDIGYLGNSDEHVNAIVELIKRVADFEDKLENGTLIELPYLHHHKEDINGLNCEFWQVVFIYEGVMLTTKAIYDKTEAEAELAKIRSK